MQHLGFRSLFAKLFASVMLALILFAVAMVLLTQLVHDKDAGIRSEVLATQILGQIDPFLHELNTAISKDNRLQSRFMLAVVKKSFDIFDESLQAKMGLYDSDGHLLMQTDHSDLPLELPPTPSLLSRVFPSFSDTATTQQAQVYSSTGYTLLYESRLPPKKPALSAALNLFTGTLLLLLIMAGVLWIIARTMTWRINQMSQQMTQLGDGDFTVRVNARGNDEIASLARGFNQAAQKIEHLVDANNLLLAHASHELRTPITRIRLQIEMMDMLAGALPSDTKEKFDKRAQAINRDLSGLNDLVESILLVSRLDAGHALQQVERLDLYDLINQERQHYPEATLIGEHIIIDGQASMLTHLIRNLLTNAMLHGVPPVTVLLYGVQTIDEADSIPDYLLQTLICSSFADYNSSDFDSYDETAAPNREDGRAASTQGDDTALTDTAADEADMTETVIALPAPPIYKNGETLVDEAAVVNEADNADATHTAVDTANDNAADRPNHDATPSSETHQIKTSAVGVDDTLATETDDNALASANDHTALKTKDARASLSVMTDYQRFTSEFSDKVKKVTWRAVPESAVQADSNQSPLLDAAAADSDLTVQKTKDSLMSKGINALKNGHSQKSAIADGSATSDDSKKPKDQKISSKNATQLDGEAMDAPRKEGLFTKHLKKTKTEPERPLPKYAVLAVIDEGAGIPEEKREDVFSPFVRLQQKNKGSGLGLSLVSQIVTAHQGRIITDTINGHTRFLVILPVKHNPHYHPNG
ncbi:ATP-binding protein [Psychrobacter celer]|uniref:HAMP domain-containing sensor histidine kinase n=1 Tax=Psychrobacter TaxID=497 RepID=UPI000C29E57C|nr:sensor histidine kinase [Psychrobacter sp. L7]MDN5733650.1 sensor histidine kinase [Psychrobacter sp.]PJX21427.1 HAMP domain-containing histidine kinase [Psychrobacter sp. L7]